MGMSGGRPITVGAALGSGRGGGSGIDSGDSLDGEEEGDDAVGLTRRRFRAASALPSSSDSDDASRESEAWLTVSSSLLWPVASEPPLGAPPSGSAPNEAWASLPPSRWALTPEECMPAAAV